MEFGGLGFDGFSLEHTNKQKWCESNDAVVAHDFKPAKVGKHNNEVLNSKDDFSLKHSSFDLTDAQHEQNMLSFSLPKLEDKNLHNIKNAGYANSGGVNTRMCILNGVKWPFTTSQWLELEQQALIYKYIIANQPIPPNLLIPIIRAFESAAFCSFPGGAFLRPNSYGWGAFHLGFSNSADPEPGRCRRTDGKKWRCAREAVPDQKYCERHINRGRHRSRKPVEAATNKNNSPAQITASCASSSAPLVVPADAASTSFAINHNFCRNTSPTIGLNSGNDALSIAKDHQYSEASSSGGFTFDQTPLNSTLRTSSLYGAYDLNTQKSLTDDPSTLLWPKSQAQYETTQLSISIPVAPSDYRSSTSSPTGREVNLSPLRRSREIDMFQMGLGHCEQSNSVPLLSWKTSVGGPLGEALTTASNSSAGSTPRADSGKAAESGRILWDRLSVL